MAAPLDQIRSALLYTAGRPVMDGYPLRKEKGDENKEKTIKNSNNNKTLLNTVWGWRWGEG